MAFGILLLVTVLHPNQTLFTLHMQIYLIQIINPGDLVITEIMLNPSAVPDADGEWFEVYNATDHPIDMLGLTISDDGFDSHVIGESLIVPSDGFVVLGNNIDQATNGGIKVDYIYGSSWFLANSDDEVIIETEDHW